MKQVLVFVLLCLGCSSPQKPASQKEHDRIPDDQWAMIDAQDRRDVPALLNLLADTSARTRADAAMAFASVGNAAAVPGLLKALNDADPVVRANAAFAFGFCGDSVSVHQLMERYSPEENPAVRGRIAEAAGRCGRRNGADLLLRRSLSHRDDTLGVLRGLFFATTTSSTDTSHVRHALSLITSSDEELDEAALQVCARSKADLVRPFAKRLLNIAMTMPDSGGVELRLPLIAALGKTSNADAFIRLQESFVNDREPRIRVMALRGIGRFEEPEKNAFIWGALNDSSGMVRDIAVDELLKLKELPSGEDLWTLAQEHHDYAVKIPLYGLVMKHADEDAKRTCHLLMTSTLEQGGLGPYLKAAVTKALSVDRDVLGTAELESAFRSARTSIEKQAAFEATLEPPLSYLPKPGQVQVDQPMNRLASFFMDKHRAYWAALTSGDAGLIANAIERMMNEDTLMLTPPDAGKSGLELVRSILHPIRDLETIQLLDAAIAKRDGKPAPKHSAPGFNHIIDRARLSTIKSPQQYRIRTSKGDIVLALEPDAAPGSCTAFDSLVTAGYYNGKYFHRVVPDFVAQGGCPRGDGYGGMPWTLRTEVGLEGFTTGAVGLASAGKDTESCQFFVMLADAPHLDGRYTRFAHVVSGMEVAWQLRVGDLMNSVERLP